MTYRSRGRSLIEVVLVRRDVPSSAVFSLLLFIAASHVSLLPSRRPFALSSFWWGSLRFFASATTFAPKERKKDNGSGGWRSWRQATTQRQQHKECMRQMPTIRHRTRPQRMWPAAAACRHRKIGAISFDCFVHYCHSFFGRSGGLLGCWSK